MGSELSQFQSLAKIRLQLQALHRAHVHGGIKNFTVSLTGSLGTIHRYVSVPKQIFGLCTLGSAYGDTDACCYYDFVSVCDEGSTQSALQALCNSYCIARISDVC